MKASNNTPENFAKVQAAIDNRRHMLGETVWNHIGTEAQNMVIVEECAKGSANMYLFIKWRMAGKPAAQA